MTEFADNKMNKQIMTVLAIVFIAMYRLLPHPWNFAPVTASAVFGGMVLPRHLAWIIPIAASLISDAFIGFSWPDMPFVYGALLIAVILGTWIGSPQGSMMRYSGKTLLGTLGASMIFFLVTNFGSWLILPMYPKTIGGLVQSYLNAIPFFQYSLAGDVFFMTIFTGLYLLAGKWLSSRLTLNEKS